MIERVTSNEQYPRVFPVGCKVPIKMQILRRVTSGQARWYDSLTDVFTRLGAAREKSKSGRAARRGDAGGNRFMWLCMEFVVLHHRTASHTRPGTPAFFSRLAMKKREMAAAATSIRGVRRARATQPRQIRRHPRALENNFVQAGGVQWTREVLAGLRA